MAALGGELLPALLTSCIIDGDSSLPTLTGNHSSNYRYSQRTDTKQRNNGNFSLPSLLKRLTNSAWKAGNDTSKN